MWFVSLISISICIIIMIMTKGNKSVWERYLVENITCGGTCALFACDDTSFIKSLIMITYKHTQCVIYFHHHHSPLPFLLHSIISSVVTPFNTLTNHPLKNKMHVQSQTLSRILISKIHVESPTNKLIHTWADSWWLGSLDLNCGWKLINKGEIVTKMGNYHLTRSLFTFAHVSFNFLPSPLVFTLHSTFVCPLISFVFAVFGSKWSVGLASSCNYCKLSWI